jgi:hypothetical protein
MIRNENGLQEKFEGCGEVHRRPAPTAAGARVGEHNDGRFALPFARNVAAFSTPEQGAAMKNPLDSLYATIALGLALTALLYAVAKAAMGG